MFQLIISLNKAKPIYSLAQDFTGKCLVDDSKEVPLFTNVSGDGLKSQISMFHNNGTFAGITNLADKDLSLIMVDTRIEGYLMLVAVSSENDFDIILVKDDSTE